MLEKFDIHITDINGTPVRKISKEELGVIVIGDNVSSFQWDGTDSNGKQMANGVYFYSIDISSDFKETDSSVLFGKIYLFR